jgi:hypothetical protein
MRPIFPGVHVLIAGQQMIEEVDGGIFSKNQINRKTIEPIMNGANCLKKGVIGNE